MLPIFYGDISDPIPAPVARAIGERQLEHNLAALSAAARKRLGVVLEDHAIPASAERPEVREQ